MPGILAEHLGELVGFDRRQGGRGPRAVSAEAVSQATGHGQVARTPWAFAYRRPPARAEVDRVQAADERRDRPDIALDEVSDEIQARHVRRGWKADRVRADRSDVDPDVAGLLGDVATGVTDGVDERRLVTWGRQEGITPTVPRRTRVSAAAG